ncbi:MAG: hypothetical protein ACRD2O_10225 [Terriglobia bacterium]
MNLNTEMEKLVEAAKRVFYGGATPTYDGDEIGTAVHVEETREAADGNPLKKDGKWGVKISATVRDMSGSVPELAQFTLAHELGHLIVPHLSDQVTMQNVEMMADLVGICLLRAAGVRLDRVIAKLSEYDTLMFDEFGDWAHPPAAVRIASLTRMEVALLGGTTDLKAIEAECGLKFSN